MFKVLLLLLAIWILIAILKRQSRPTGPSSPPVKHGNMVQCEVCSVHLPDTEAISAGGRHYCCEAHFLQRKAR
ncbi:uncharacterized protein NMK_1112 [Novimethylophilus kurashikiensis]|uniref:Uncharacterized protein n=1 Tax=Novimethylophilus kurashikiensis TaxID=1825523 RepID=A0A2R5FA42_9PROT|nr:PP0621 family protein [Novimethylophilus kurashikiensis]GBG13561.1 uncharacterized protein NMK_1112 [Novimethylophilus kurashikiensis]